MNRLRSGKRFLAVAMRAPRVHSSACLSRFARTDTMSKAPSGVLTHRAVATSVLRRTFSSGDGKAPKDEADADEAQETSDAGTSGRHARGVIPLLPEAEAAGFFAWLARPVQLLRFQWAALWFKDLNFAEFCDGATHSIPRVFEAMHMPQPGGTLDRVRPLVTPVLHFNLKQKLKTSYTGLRVHSKFHSLDSFDVHHVYNTISKDLTGVDGMTPFEALMRRVQEAENASRLEDMSPDKLRMDASMAFAGDMQVQLNVEIIVEATTEYAVIDDKSGQVVAGSLEPEQRTYSWTLQTPLLERLRGAEKWSPIDLEWQYASFGEDGLFVEEDEGEEEGDERDEGEDEKSEKKDQAGGK